MKIETAALATWVLLATDLFARLAVQGVEQALIATAVEYGLNGMRVGRRLLAHLGR
jgi:hypothetical protein